MEILEDAIIKYAKIISNKYNISLRKLIPLIDTTWELTIPHTIIKEPLYINALGDKFIIINNSIGIKLIY
jgi:hypothetical protein